MKRLQKDLSALKAGIALRSIRMAPNSRLEVSTRRHIEEQLIGRALREPSFREGLLKNPNLVLERDFGIRLPSDCEIKVFEEAPGAVCLVVHAYPYEGVSPDTLRERLGITLEDVAKWTADNNRQFFPEPGGDARLLVRVWQDPSFKQRLIDDPVGSLSRELGLTLPTTLRVHVLEETPNLLWLVAPVALDEIGKEWDLPDEELETVATGQEMLLIGASTTVASCSAHTFAACCCLITN